MLSFMWKFKNWEYFNDSSCYKRYKHVDIIIFNIFNCNKILGYKNMLNQQKNDKFGQNLMKWNKNE